MMGLKVYAGTCEPLPNFELSNILRQFDATKEHIMLADLADVVSIGEW